MSNTELTAIIDKSLKAIKSANEETIASLRRRNEQLEKSIRNVEYHKDEQIGILKNLLNDKNEIIASLRQRIAMMNTAKQVTIYTPAMGEA